MKEFMLIFLGADYGTLGLSPEEMQGQMGKWWAWHAKMEKAGILKSGHALQPNVKRLTGKDRVVTDRTSAELKELVGGYYVVDAKNEKEAIEIAQDYPDFDLGGTVEVREVMVFEK